MRCLLAFTLAAATMAGAQNGTGISPGPEKLTYRIVWRMVTAGTATVEATRPSPTRWQLLTNLESAGLVSRLYRVLDSYKVTTNDKFCGISSQFDAQEGKRHLSTTINYENERHKLFYVERDLLRNTEDKHEVEIAPCTYEISGALHVLRETQLEPGKSTTLPMTNGKKLVNAKVEAQVREKINVGDKGYATVRYEAFVFDNVIYRRKGRLFLWMTDDAERLPVQLKIQVGFPIGNVTLELEKVEKL